MLFTILLLAGFLYQAFDIYFDWKERKSEKKPRFKNKAIDNIFHWGKYLLALFLLIIAISEYSSQKSQKAILATNGKFKSLKMSIDTPVLSFGNHDFFGNEKNFDFGGPVEPMKLEKVNNEIYLNGHIRDSKGDVIANLFERGWEVTNTNGIDYNNDKTAFEIVTGGRVVFQIRLTRDTVYYNGMLCDEGGWCIFLDPISGFTTLPKLQGTQRFILPNDFLLKPIFKYPRFRYCGVREKD